MRTFFFLFAFVSACVFAQGISYTVFTVDSLPISCMERGTCKLIVSRVNNNVVIVAHHKNDTCNRLDDFIIDESKLPFSTDYFIIEKDTFLSLSSKDILTWQCVGGVRVTR